MRYLSNALTLYVELGYRKGEADTHAEFAYAADAAGNAAISAVHNQHAEAIYANLRQASS
jgi:hypothetical protein